VHCIPFHSIPFHSIPFPCLSNRSESFLELYLPSPLWHTAVQRRYVFNSSACLHTGHGLAAFKGLVAMYAACETKTFDVYAD
jgi:hypothetical protein